MIETTEEVTAFLEHYGVPGMKWGVRKGPQDSVRSARKEVGKVGKAARKSMRDFKKASDSSGRKAAADDYAKVLETIKSKEFKQTYAKASTMGKGEKAAHILVFGPFAALTIPQASQAANARGVIGAQQEVEVGRLILKSLRETT